MSNRPIRNRRGIVSGIALTLLALGGAAARPAHADWLVTRDGGRVETRGPWQLKGKLLVFTRADDGSLSSLRAADVDLGASASVTADAKVQAAAPPPPEAPKKKKLAVLTDASFPKAAPPAAAAEKAADQDKKAPPPSGPVVVGPWQRSDGDGGLVIEGTLHNTTGIVVGNASVQVQLYNEAGDRVGEAEGLLASTSIEPNGSIGFKARFPGVFTFADAKFRPQGIPLNLAPPPDPADQKPADQKPGEKSPPP
jgi:hypothetical protein